MVSPQLPSRPVSMVAGGGEHPLPSPLSSGRRALARQFCVGVVAMRTFVRDEIPVNRSV